MKNLYLANQLTVDEHNNSLWSNIGVFTDHQMALSWLNEDLHKRSIVTLPCLDKTFCQLSLESVKLSLSSAKSHDITLNNAYEQ